jgi:hypothetical protein
MGLQGDLATLDLAGLFQSLESARKSGVLTIQDGRDVSRLLFVEGRLAAVGYPDRPGVADFLAAAGIVSREELERAGKGRRKRRTICELVVDAGLVDHAQLVSWITARITDEACEVLMTRGGKFEFQEGEAPEGLFDAEELALGIGLPAGPLLLEAARRSDHWKLIRERIPSDSVHYELARQPKEATDPVAAERLERVVELLDGARSIGEVAAHFPHQRFEVYELLSQLAATRTIRPCDPAELAKRVRELAPRDRARAWELLGRGLELDPRNLSLLTTKALLAEEIGELEQACEALKMVAHVELESGGNAGARSALERLKTLDGDDLFVWEKSFELALEEKRTAEALVDGKRLVDLYRGPGLHKKACAVIERLFSLAGKSWELVRDLARLRAAAGDVPGALAVLEEYGAARLGEESYPLAKRAYDEMLVLDPRCKRAKQAVEEIASGALARRRAYWRKMRRRVLIGAAAVVLVPWATYEFLARHAFVNATRQVLSEGWIESGKLDEAIAAYREVENRFGCASVSLYEAPSVIEALEAKRAAAARTAADSNAESNSESKVEQGPPAAESGGD